jgi:hypothetical protein
MSENGAHDMSLETEYAEDPNLLSFRFRCHVGHAYTAGWADVSDG